jgi:integrase-like protein
MACCVSAGWMPADVRHRWRVRRPSLWMAWSSFIVQSVPIPGNGRPRRASLVSRNATSNMALWATMTAPSRWLASVSATRPNAIMERWIRTCRTELLDCNLILNQTHLLHALREYEDFYNHHRPHRALHAAAPQRALPPPITNPDPIKHLDVRRQDRLGGILHEYHHAA